MKTSFEQEVETALAALRNGKTILYPTDTVWGIGCDATNQEAVKKIYDIKERSDTKSMIVLLADERDLYQYVAGFDLELLSFLEAQTKPTTVIFEGAIGFPQNLVAADGSIAIRLVKDAFCRHLVKRLQRPIVSTSANISGNPAPAFFRQIDQRIKDRVDHIVAYRQDEETAAQPSQIIRWKEGAVEYIRR